MQPTIEQLYLEWLKGSSLRKLAPRIGITHRALSRRFEKRFGVGATNKTKQSLIRSILRDYADAIPELERRGVDVIAWAWQLVNAGVVESNLHRANYTMKAISEYQNQCDEGTVDLVVQYHDPDLDSEVSNDTFGFLRLPLAIAVYESVAKVLHYLMLGDVSLNANVFN